MRLWWIGWSEKTLAKIRRKHHVEPWEIKEAFTTYPEGIVWRRSGRNRYALYSRTKEGEYLFSVVDVTDESGRDDLRLTYLEPPNGERSGRTKRGAIIITVRKMSQTERQWYNEIRSQ